MGVSSKESAILSSACATRALQVVSASAGVSPKESASLISRLLRVPLVRYPDVCVCHSCSETCASFSGRVVQRKCNPDFCLCQICFKTCFGFCGRIDHSNCYPDLSVCHSCFERCPGFCGHVAQRANFVGYSGSVLYLYCCVTFCGRVVQSRSLELYNRMRCVTFLWV